MFALVSVHRNVFVSNLGLCLSTGSLAQRNSCDVSKRNNVGFKKKIFVTVTNRFTKHMGYKNLQN